MSIFERFKRRESEERDLAEERREEAVKRAQDELRERLKKKDEGGEQKEVDLTEELNK